MKDNLSSLYPAHLQERQRKAEEALHREKFDVLVIYSGTPFRYHADDQDAPFRPFPHFAHWAPLKEPGNFLLVRPGGKPLLIRVKPEGYWHEQASLDNPFWLPEFDIIEVPTEGAVWKELDGRLARSSVKNAAYIGDNEINAKAHGIKERAINPPGLLAALNADRSKKSEYEVANILEANRIGAMGHRAAREEFLAGGSELYIHQAYMKAVGALERELPYETIVALNEKAAILHYQEKRSGVREGASLLLDAGADSNGYASDITRTWTKEEADSLFKELILGVEKLQQELCAEALPGLSFAKLQKETHIKIGKLLSSLGILKIEGQDAADSGITKAFFPHGVGHFLGLQVHDVGAEQKAQTPETEHTPPAENVRNKNVIETGQVFTIEPGVYFIEMLLRPHTSAATSAHFNWPLIERLSSYGGVRIEDDVLATKNGIRNLTREHL
jgi:Xaa-Pro dipeptidase